MELKRITRLAMLLSLAIVLNLVESIVPIFNGMIPGLKLGLANTITIVVLYIFSFKDAFMLSIFRVIIVGILRTGLFSPTFFFSLGGCLFSVISMFIVKQTKLSIIGVSIVGSLFHSIGQILVSIIILNNSMIYVLPYLLLFSIPTGIIIGFISKEMIKYFENRLK